MFHKIYGVKSLPEMILLVWFADGEVKQYDVKPLLAKRELFSELQNEQLFSQVKIDAGGYGISWNDDLDLSCSELWENGISVDLVKVQREKLIERFAEVRRQAGLSQKQLEEASGVKQPVIARLECGGTNPQLETVLRILLPAGKTLGVVDLMDK